MAEKTPEQPTSPTRAPAPAFDQQTINAIGRMMINAAAEYYRDGLREPPDIVSYETLITRPLERFLAEACERTPAAHVFERIIVPEFAIWYALHYGNSPVPSIMDVVEARVICDELAARFRSIGRGRERVFLGVALRSPKPSERITRNSTS